MVYLHSVRSDGYMVSAPFLNLNQSTDLTWRINYIPCYALLFKEIMKEVLIKLINNDNEFNIEIFGQERKCKIIKLDLWGLEEGKGRALVKFDTPVKKTVRREVEGGGWGLDRDDHIPMEDVETDTYEEWVSIGY